MGTEIQMRLLQAILFNMLRNQIAPEIYERLLIKELGSEMDVYIFSIFYCLLHIMLHAFGGGIIGLWIHGYHGDIAYAAS